MMKLIINADDFGLSSQVNKAIVKAFRQGLISSTSIMVNTPAFEQACELIFNEDLFGKVVIHLNLTNGRPHTKKMSANPIVCDEDVIYRTNRQTLFFLRKRDRITLGCELQAQIDKLKGKGIQPTHIDSHHHYHTEWAVGREVICLAKENGIPPTRSNIPKLWNAD